MNRERTSFLLDATAGPVLGCVLALAEYLWHAARGTPLLLPSFLPGMLLLYMLVWGLAGISSAVLLSLLRRAGLRRFLPAETQISLLAATAVGLTAHAVAVSQFFTNRQRPFTSVLFAGALLLIVLLFPLFRRVVPRGWARGMPRALLAAAFVACCSLPLQLLPERGGIGRAGAARETDGSAAGKPHILLVVFDTLRFDHTGPYGYGRETTPTLDRLAGEGALFDRAYAPSSWTLPSTASLLTGRYPSGHGVHDRTSALPEEVEAISSVLRKNGYRTGLFSGNPFVEPNFGFGQGYERVYSTTPSMYMRLFYLPEYLKRTVGRLPMVRGGTDRLVIAYESFWRREMKRDSIEGDDLAKELFRWLDEKDDRPFFAHLQIIEPHDPYVGHGRFGPEGVSFGRMNGLAPLHPFDTLPDPSPKDSATTVGRYDDDVWSADRVLASIVRGLADRGLLGDTWMVLTADHGEELYDHGGLGHGNSLYEELVRVPLLFHGKGVVPRRIGSFARLIDVAPTLAALAGAPPPEGSAGMSLLPLLLSGKGETGIPSIFAELSRSHDRHAVMHLDGDGTKVIRSASAGKEVIALFDLSRDPAEQVDLSGKEPGRLEEALDSLSAAQERAGTETAGRGEATALDPVTERRLRALGYVE